MRQGGVAELRGILADLARAELAKVDQAPDGMTGAEHVEGDGASTRTVDESASRRTLTSARPPDVGRSAAEQGAAKLNAGLQDSAIGPAEILDGDARDLADRTRRGR
jgi:hypothetical protein